ncbi:Na+/H+ antiporter NhaC family protein [Sulfurimonas sp.]|uniref:Na+/H+ antiporter NhaC family protein n=1 Tax=Sulfurimonas sp. TaxID=2022749 RepID=UPI002B46A9B0|nr:Na+/H+ antiporter NhaC family protein [Sulfurimonas sp.]
MALIQKSGGINGFVDFMLHRLRLVSSQKSSLMLSYFIGVVIFIESSITSLIAGAVGRPFCHKYKIPQAKLAFVCDSTSAPISSLLVFNGWGALLLGLISTQINQGQMEGNAVSILIESIFFNFYAMSALVVTFFAVYFNINIGPMRYTKYMPSTKQTIINTKTSMSYMILPITLMIVLVFLFLYLSGDGNILQGSGSSAIFYTVLSTLIFTLIYYVPTKNMTLSIWGNTAYKGAKELFPIAMILLFSFAIGEVTSELKTGEYLASLADENINIYFLSTIIFLVSSLISFSTGTSWGTFSIMIPIAVPMAITMGVDVPLAIGAVISGGIFGDHCSPISDTTIISSMASECEVIEHVQTQLPYAIISALIATSLFVLFSFY